ncbi:MAG: dienelactone hydrolase family protein [Trueperaceae bacterium]|nr:dienelactone hydrolase family protein [Trueperaceae bacterium]MCO5173587.1 dienelactone hydrolase family protein [Trueperaceae bacterium]MCW5818576.1 dienelactone hydrolase family protein [Trueperaceae bacterium]
MAELVLFHHVLGLTPGIIALADRLRAGGHTVHTPDMYEGKRFATLDEGMAHVRSVGVPLQIHAQEHDPEFDNGYDLPTAQAVVAEAADGELFLYPGDKHFFADSSTGEYDAEATDLLVAHALALLARV